MTELSDELLVAYVDGQLARKQTQAVEKVLEQDDVIAKRVAALKHAHGRLEAAFEAILTGEEADAAATARARIPPACSSPGRRSAKSAWRRAGLVAAFVMLLAGFGWPLTTPEFSRNPLASPIRTMSAASRRVGRRTPPARTPC